MSLLVWLFLVTVSYVVKAKPVIEGSSPSGDTVIAISSSDPDFSKHFFELPSSGYHAATSNIAEDIFKNSFTFVAPGKAVAGNGRSFASTSNINPFTIPFFSMPINIDSFGFSNDWIKNVDSLYNNGLFKGGDVKTVTAVNHNGRVYSKVRTVTFDDKGNKKTDVSNVSSNH